MTHSAPAASHYVLFSLRFSSHHNLVISLCHVFLSHVSFYRGCFWFLVVFFPWLSCVRLFKTSSALTLPVSYAHCFLAFVSEICMDLEIMDSHTKWATLSVGLFIRVGLPQWANQTQFLVYPFNSYMLNSWESTNRKCGQVIYTILGEFWAPPPPQSLVVTSVNNPYVMGPGDITICQL